MLSIMIYSVIKSKVCELPGHIKLIEEFTSPDIQNSKLGQGLFMLKAATDHVLHGILLRRASIKKLRKQLTLNSGTNKNSMNGIIPKGSEGIVDRGKSPPSAFRTAATLKGIRMHKVSEDSWIAPVDEYTFDYCDTPE